jgi:hypothetical protein
MDIKLMLVWRTILRSHFHILKKVDETSEVPAHSSAVYAASVGENYVLAEPPIQETDLPSERQADWHAHRCEPKELRSDSVSENDMASKGTIIVTGGSQGIGAGVVQAFLERGYNVVAPCVGENYVLAEPRRQEAVPPSAK